MILRIADDGHAPAVRPDDLTLRDRLYGVVRSLAVHVRPERADQPRWALFLKNGHVADTANRGDQFRPLSLTHHRPPLPFDRSDRSVVVDSHDQHVRLACGILQIANVTDMQNVE